MMDSSPQAISDSRRLLTGKLPQKLPMRRIVEIVLASLKTHSETSEASPEHEIALIAFAPIVKSSRRTAQVSARQLPGCGALRSATVQRSHDRSITTHPPPICIPRANPPFRGGIRASRKRFFFALQHTFFFALFEATAKNRRHHKVHNYFHRISKRNKTTY